MNQNDASVIVVAFIIGVALFAWLCGYIAHQKGLSDGFWAVMGALFGIFALIALAFTQSNKPTQYRRWLSKSSTEELIGSYRYYPSVEAQAELERRGVNRGVNLPQYGLQPVL
jgi:hypothetical protein